MTIKSLRFLDFFREFITFSLVLAVFIFNHPSAVMTLIWYLCFVSVFALIAAGINAHQTKTQFTTNKARFEFFNLLAMSLIIVYFGHWFVATIVFITHFLFFATCFNNDKKDE